MGAGGVPASSRSSLKIAAYEGLSLQKPVWFCLADSGEELLQGSF